MLTDEEKQEVETIAAQSLHWKDACVDALLAIQKRRGWISDEALSDVAAVLGMAPAELDSVVTFYDRIFRKPAGRHVVMLCDSPSCWITGYDGLLEHVSGRLGIAPGETSEDGSFTLLPSGCLGACDHAPGMMINDRFYGDLTPKRIDEVLDSLDGEQG